MKNRTKFLWTCAGLAAAGFVLAMVGVLMGGRFYGVGADLKGLHVYAPALEEKNGATGSGGMQQNQELLEAFDSMQIQAEYADIRVARTDGDAYSLSYNLPGQSELLKEVRDGKLFLTMRLKGSLGSNQIRWFWFDFSSDNSTDASVSGDASITVLVPKNAKLSEVSFSTESGDITCEGIQADSLKTEASYGDIDLQKIQAQEMEMKLESGRLQMEQVEGERCRVVNEYGNASFDRLVLSKDLQIDMESGDVRFRDTVMHGLELKNAYGDIDGEQTVFGDMQMSVESGNCRFHDLTFDSCSILEEYGDVELQLDRDVADLGYELRTEYGEIKINGEPMGETFVTLDKDKNPFLKIICESGNIAIQSK